MESVITEFVIIQFDCNRILKCTHMNTVGAAQWDHFGPDHIMILKNRLIPRRLGKVRMGKVRLG
jgi:hypothetical protein